MEGARTVSYRPITDEENLIYLDWVDWAIGESSIN